MKTLSLTAAGLLLCSAAAMAQTSTATPNATPPASSTGSAVPLRQEMSDSLKQAGFSDVHVAPDSFFVQAKDKHGNPIAMLVGPNSVTELVDAAPSAAASGNSEFVTNAGSDMLSSKLVGTDVRNSSNQDIGTIRDVAVRNGRVQAYVLDVGGFLGMGSHYVAVSPSAVSVNWDASTKADARQP